MAVRTGRNFVGSANSSQLSLTRDGFFAVALTMEILLVVGVAVLIGVAYHALVYGHAGPIDDFFVVGALTAIFYVLPTFFHSHYRVKNYLPGERGPARQFSSWNFAFFCIAVIGFLTKSTAVQSRGWLLLLYGIGLVCVFAFEVAMDHCRRAAFKTGRLMTQRAMVVGTEADVDRFLVAHSPAPDGLSIAAIATIPAPQRASLLPDNSNISHDVEVARRHNVSDVIVLADWANGPHFARIAEKFMDLPASVHLGQLEVVERYPQLRVGRVGSVTTLLLRSEPLSMLQALVKRAFDISVASTALMLLAPLHLLIAILIKVDSPGPIFFRQRRRGFNQKEFKIWKYRTLFTMDDGNEIIQVKTGDARVTRLGGLLRKYNVDELPQLINVVRGEMSLVGPRPHAVAHDGYYQQIIDHYTRRLSVRPGITGWAQIHGHRGATETPGSMEARVADDLYYIENWSIALDLYILLMTVVAPKAYRNAY